jgi:hypothetical protein
MPVIVVAWEAEIGRIAVGGQPRQIVPKLPEQNSGAQWSASFTSIKP